MVWKPLLRLIVACEMNLSNETFFLWIGLDSGEDQIFILCYDCVGVAFKDIIHRTFHHYQLNRFRDWWYYFPRLLSISSSILTQFWCSISHLWSQLMIEIVNVPSYMYEKCVVKLIYSNYVSLYVCFPLSLDLVPTTNNIILLPFHL